jgi:hypothetical protein
MRHVLLATVALGLCAALAYSRPGAELSWKYQGYKSLPAAAAAAQVQNKRLLVGLSGAFT